MALSFDGATKLITITTVNTLNVMDLWSRWVDWFLTSDNSKYGLAMSQVGGDDIDVSAGTKIPIYIYLLNGWTIKPREASHTLSVTGGILLVDGGGDPFVNTTGSYQVRINYQQPVQAITVATGGSSGVTVDDIWTDDRATEVITNVNELHQLQGLDSANPMTVTTSSRTTGDINLVITGDGETVSVVTRV